MANSQIRIAKKNLYTIDLKDENDNVFHTLTFHLGDANLPMKLLQLYDDAIRELKKLEETEESLKKEILAEGNTEVPDIENITAEEIQKKEPELSPATRKFFYAEAEGYNRLRVILDKLLGEGTCDIVFGDYNDKEEFTDFLNALTPEFEKMGVRISNIQKNLYSKYAPKNNQVI